MVNKHAETLKTRVEKRTPIPISLLPKVIHTERKPSAAY